MDSHPAGDDSSTSDGQLYKVKLASGRVVGPIPLAKIKQLIIKNHILGQEEARLYPNGVWTPINKIQEVVDLILKHLEGKLAFAPGEEEKIPNLPGAEVDPLAPTQMLGAQLQEIAIPDEPAPISAPVASPIPPVEAKRPAPPSEDRTSAVELNTSGDLAGDDEGEKTLVHDPDAPALHTGVRASENFDEDDRHTQVIEMEGSSATNAIQEIPNDFQVNVSREETIMIRRENAIDPGDKKSKRKSILGVGKGELKKLPIAQRIRFWITLGAAGLVVGYAINYVFIDDESGGVKIFKKAPPFRPVLPNFLEKTDPQKSQALYNESMKYYALDHVEGYTKASRLLLDAAAYDSSNVKALAMLASSYLNLIDSSNKDETYFAVISKLIDLARAKSVDLPEAVIADAEFLMVLNQPESAQNRIIEYTKINSEKFGVEMFYYLSQTFFERGDYESAVRYVSNIPDNRVFSPKVHLLKGQIAEKLNAFEDAFNEYRKAFGQVKDHAKSRLAYLELLNRSGRLKEGLEHLQFLSAHPTLLSPKDSAHFYYLGSRYYQLEKNGPKSLEAIEKAVQFDPKNSDYVLEYYTLKAASHTFGDQNAADAAKQKARLYLYLAEGEKLVKEGRFQDALDRFLSARETNFKSALPLIKAGDMFLELSHYSNALLNYKKAFELEPHSFEIAGKYVRTLILSYEWDEATQVIERLRRVPKSQSLVDRLSGDLAARQGQYVQALTSYRNAMRRDQIDPEVYLAYGRTLQLAGEFVAAPFFYTLALRFDPSNIDAIIGTAKCMAQSQSIDRAINYLQDNLQKLGGHRAELITAVGELQLQKGDMLQAQRTLQQVMQMNPTFPAPWKIQAQLYAKQQGLIKDALDKSLDAWKSYSDRNPSDPMGYIERYQIFKGRNQFDKAFDELNKVYSVYPKFPNIHVYRGRLYVTMGNIKSALAEFQEEIKNNPKSLEGMIEYGKARMDSGDPVEAMKSFNAAMEIDPRSADAKNQAGIASFKMKNYPSAAALFRTAIALDPGNPLYYKRLGTVLRNLGDNAGASEAYKKYLELDPGASDRQDLAPFL